MRMRDVEALLDETLAPTDPPGMARYVGGMTAKGWANPSGDVQPGEMVEVLGIHSGRLVWVRKPGQAFMTVVSGRQLAPAAPRSPR